MKFIKFPTTSEFESLCTRSTLELSATVGEILSKVEQDGDRALFDFSERFDKHSLESLRVPEEELARSGEAVPSQLKGAIKRAIANIEKFHSSQADEVLEVETSPGITCFRKSVPIQNVGLYIPGGSAPLFSTLLMLAVPAKIAGCSRILLMSPPAISPVILYCAKELQIEEVFQVGGAQAIGAMAYGTESVPRVDKIFGPGNQYVTAAKKTVASEGRVAIDLPAGPSEVLIIADDSANTSFIAADLLAQAEHGPDSQVILLTTSERIFGELPAELERQLAKLSRADIARTALESSASILFEGLSSCMRFSNQYAPEHLILSVEAPDKLASEVTSAGSVFLGQYTPESLGDYASGTNHTLPTNGYAAAYSGVSLDSFVKKITFQSASEEGLKNLGPDVEIMARAEGLDAHAEAVAIRLRGLAG